MTTFLCQGMRNQYWVLYNYVRAEKVFNCNESLTYTTHGDFSFLDNLEPLLARWLGPISVSVYAPGSDLDDTLDSILYFRDCTHSDLVRKYATFHVFFDMTHIPASIPRHTSLLKKVVSCYITSRLTYSDEFTLGVCRELTVRSPRAWTLTGPRPRTGTDSAWTTRSMWPGTWPGSPPAPTSCSHQTLNSIRGR